MRCSLYLFINLFFALLTSSNIRLEVISGFIYSTDQSTKIFLLKTEYTPKAVARFVIILNFHYDWMEKDGLKVTSPEHKQDVVRC